MSEPHDTNTAPADRLPSQAVRLVEFAADIELFHTPDNEAFATVRVGTHHENFPLRERTFRKRSAPQRERRSRACYRPTVPPYRTGAGERLLLEFRMIIRREMD